MPWCPNFPLALTAPTGDSRLFIAEKGGRVRVVKNGTLLTAPFLNISTLISTGGEQGLLGLAFDPQYAVNGRFFVSYTDVSGSNVLASYTRSLANPDVADPASAVIRLTVGQPFDNHNGGHIAFGPDGFLYMGIGDGGSGGDPQGNGQDPTDLLGSMLRLDVERGHGLHDPVRATRSSTSSGAAASCGTSGSATPGASASTGRPATSTSPTSGRATARR